METVRVLFLETGPSKVHRPDENNRKVFACQVVPNLVPGYYSRLLEIETSVLTVIVGRVKVTFQQTDSRALGRLSGMNTPDETKR